MDVVSVVATSRSTTEHRVANDYTVRQLMHVAAVYMKDKFMVLDAVAKSFGGSGTVDTAPTNALKPDRHDKRKPYPARLPSWFKPKPGYKVVSMDAPMHQIRAAYIGKEPGR